ncbi:MAG: methionyl-tRNA formyltransferase [Coriobacteriia bacterium]|nr:methionyl-tRNA formyltransferase [Coriobacteriia bacterium]
MSEAPIRVVFMGTPEFAIPALETLARMDHIQIIGVYTAPDAPSRRGTQLFPTPVKAVAEELGLTVRTPATLRDSAEIAHLAGLKPDLIVVVAYGQILPVEILEIPQLGCINIHASLLPRWRGAAPIQRALLEGDIESGVSIMRMEEGLDTGPCCAQEVISLRDEESFDEVQMALARSGARLLKRNLDDIVSGDVRWTEQREIDVTYAPKVDKADMTLSPTLTARQLFDRVRASSDSAPARLKVGDKDVRVLGAHLTSAHSHHHSTEHLPHAYSHLAPGHLRFVENTVVIAGSDPDEEVLVLTDVKPAGSRELTAFQWALGMHLTGDTTWQ